MGQGVSKKPKNEDFAELCDKTGGNVSAIARSLGVRRATVTNWINDTDFFKQCLDSSREEALDLAEDRAMMLIAGIPVKNDKEEIIGWQERPDSGLIKFVLATKGKSRGYVERQEHTGKDGAPLEQVITHNITPESVALFNELFDKRYK